MLSPMKIRRLYTALTGMALLMLFSHFQDNALTRYCNARYSFCIQYPRSFQAQGESANGDGQVFRSQDGQAEVRAYGALEVEDLRGNLMQEYALVTGDLRVSYKVVKPDWFIVSGIDKDGNISYRKTVRKKIRYMGDETPATWVYQTLMVTYPETQQKLYDGYCHVIAKSL